MNSDERSPEETKAETLPARVAREAKTVRLMLELYCRDHHERASGLCDECSSLWEYVQKRLLHCPLRADKPTCLNCTIHCYTQARREQIRMVMRYSGPRMAYRHPVLSVLHLLEGRRKPSSGDSGGTP